jgi:hypothetical protein
VQLQLRRRNDVADDIGRMERDRAAVDDDLERLQLAAIFEPPGFFGT